MFVILQIICRLLSTISFLFVTNVRVDPPTMRQTLYGPVEGAIEISVLNQTYYSFRGIPFAEPPITGFDAYTSEFVDRRFKVREKVFQEKLNSK